MTFCNSINTMLAAGFLAGGSRQEKASVRLPCFGKKLAANVSSAYEVELANTNELLKYILKT